MTLIFFFDLSPSYANTYVWGAIMTYPIILLLPSYFDYYMPTGHVGGSVTVMVSIR